MNETQAITVRLPSDLYNQLRDAAYNRRIPQAEIVRLALIAYLGRPELPPPA